MEVSNFLKVLKKHKYTLIIVPVITVIITYFLVRNQPNSYSSEAKIATGLVDQTQNILNNQGDVQESKIAQEFSNLTELLKSKKVMDQLAYKLMIHDLTSEPYRKPSKLFDQLNADAKKHALETFTDLYNKRESLSLFDNDQNGLSELIASMHYDDVSLQKTLSIYRVQNSDYIEVDFDSENPELSAVVVNTLCSEFITYYTLLVKGSQKKAVGFLGNMLKAKQDTLDKRMATLKAYKIKNHVLNLNEKAKSVYGQLSDFETRKEEIAKNVQSTQAAINNIDDQFNPADRKYFESSKIAVSQQIIATKTQLEAANEKYIQSNFDPIYKAEIDSLNNVVSSQIGQLSDKYVLNPLSSKQNLVDQKLTLQIQNQIAQHSSKAIDDELNRLSTEFNGLVPLEGTIQSLESAVDVATKEYLEILQKYNQANLESNIDVQLRMTERAGPGVAQPSKKMLLVIISGIIGFSFCIIVLFILFFFDNSIKDPRALANKTGMPVLGHINLLKSSAIDLREIWKETTSTGELREFKNLMQSIRFEVDHDLGIDKILVINSLENGEGKTFLAINLAYAYSLVNKKVLLIDANFDNPGITRFTKTKFYLEDFLGEKADGSILSVVPKITFMGNRGGDVSLLELSSEKNITEKLGKLKTVFDVILVEVSSLTTLNKSKEWTSFADKILMVFEAGKNITEHDKHQIEYLKNAGGRFMGWILNVVNKDRQAADKE